jgi:adenylosuccinate lyase
LADTAFGLTREEMNSLLSAEQFTGRAKEQTEEFLSEAKKTIEVNRELLGINVVISV